MSAVVILPKKKKTFQAAVVEDEPEVFKPPTSSGGNAKSDLSANQTKGKGFTIAAAETEQDPRYTSMTESEQELYKVLIGDPSADVSKIDFSKPEPKKDQKPVPAPEPEAGFISPWQTAPVRL